MVRKQTGFTLTEIVVVFSLLLVLLALMAMYFVRGQHYVTDIDAYSTLQRETAVTLQQVCDRLASSTTEYLRLHNQEKPSDHPSHLYGLSPYSDKPGDPLIEFGGTRHQVVWKKWIGFYHVPETQLLYFVEIPLTPPTFNLIAQPKPKVSYPSLLSAPRPRQLGRRISEFWLEQFNERIAVTLVGKGVSPVPLRTEKDKILEIRLTGQVLLVQ